MAKLSAENITVTYENEPVIEKVSISLEKGEIVSLIGASGSGKTTFFNAVAGLYAIDEGKVFLDGEDITGQTGKVSYMLQKDLLLAHYTIIDNVSLPLVMKGEKKKDARKRASQYFDLFGLSGCENKYPTELSGGMRQRAALMRTYLTGNNVVLLDEPFSALDTITKNAMHSWYLDIIREIGLSTIFVTHDIEEAILLSDRVYILSGVPGRITDEIKIDLPKPRSIDNVTDEAFVSYKRLIRERI
ncbi:MAG: ABC transporter ATP-binding protein [Ruminococcaceae bacterium]|nr:ABC transporter ATP-binding protein [Oscillospiraceae bacterium]